MTRRLMVIGSAGQVGHCLVQQAANCDWTLLAVDRELCDITNPALVEQAIRNFMPDVIINAAAYTAVDRAESEEIQAYAINCYGPRCIAENAAAVGAVLLHISTDYVFDGQKSGPYVETDEVGPQGIYGASKLAGELAVANACERHLTMRTAWVFGEYGHNFVKTMLRLGRERDVLSIVADQWGGPTYAGDIAAALLLMAKQALAPSFKDWGLYHFAGEPHVSWHGFASEIFSAAARQNLLDNIPRLNAIDTPDYPTPAKRPANSRLDCLRIKNVFGISPCDWRTALADLRPYLSL